MFAVKSVGLALIVSVGLTGVGRADDLAHIYVSPQGDDRAEGVSPTLAVKSFGRALQLGSRLANKKEVVVKFLDGNYGDMNLRVVWPYGATAKLTIEADSDKGRVVFDGRSGSKTWMQVVDSPGPESNVVVRGFVVRNYRQAIQFAGDRFAVESSLTNNLIEHNVFENIGQFKDDVEPALAAIHMLNTSHSIIRGNTFRNIKNLQRCDGLHAIYLAGGSSNNMITDNTFDGGCGDTIKVRDRSNFNKIERNSFSRQDGRSLFVDSFCDPRKQVECKDAKQECPSWGNIFKSNQIDLYSRAKVKFVHRHVGASNIPVCPVAPGPSTAARIIAD